LQVTEAFLSSRCSFMSWSSLCAEHGYRDCARFFTCVMKLSMFSSTAVKSSGKLSSSAAVVLEVEEVVSPRSRSRCDVATRRDADGGGGGGGCGLRPPRNLRAHCTPGCVCSIRTTSISITEERSLLAAISSTQKSEYRRTGRR